MANGPFDTTSPFDQKPKPKPRPAAKPKKTGGNPFGAPPKYTPPAKQKTGERQYLAWAHGHGLERQTAADIWYWSHQSGTAIDPYYLSSVLLEESGGRQIDPATGNVVSSGQAVGISQLAVGGGFSWVGKALPWDHSAHPKTFTYDDNPQTGLLNYGVNLRMGATLAAAAVAKYGYKNAYLQGLNPADPNKQTGWNNILKILNTRPRTLTPLAPSEGPANVSAKTIGGKNPYVTPTFKQGETYVAGITQGRVGSGLQGGPEGAAPKAGKYITTRDPNKALQYNGAPLTISGFKSLTAALAPYYISYTGKRPTASQILNFAKNNWSPYTLEQLLSKGPNFENSPIFKQNGVALQDALKTAGVIGQHARVPKELMRQAILHQWDSSTLAAEIRKTPLYLQGNEFKGNIATLLNVQTSIMGSADPQSMIAIKDAALAGWNSDQYAAWLRSQPNYQYSQEYQAKAFGMLEGLGALTGHQVTMTPGAGAGPGQRGQPVGNLPQDKRVAGKAAAAGADTGLGFSFSG